MSLFSNPQAHDLRSLNGCSGSSFFSCAAVATLCPLREGVFVRSVRCVLWSTSFDFAGMPAIAQSKYMMEQNRPGHAGMTERPCGGLQSVMAGIRIPEFKSRSRLHHSVRLTVLELLVLCILHKIGPRVGIAAAFNNVEIDSHRNHSLLFQAYGSSRHVRMNLSYSVESFCLFQRRCCQPRWEMLRN
jgi:hypothetical protein